MIIFIELLKKSILATNSIYFCIDSVETSQIVTSEQEIDKSKEMVMGFYEMFASVDIKKIIIVLLYLL